MFTVKITNGNEVVHALDVDTLADLKVAQAFIVDEYDKILQQKKEDVEAKEKAFQDLFDAIGCSNPEGATHELGKLGDVMADIRCKNVDELVGWIQEHDGDIEDRVDEFVEQETNYSYSTLQDLIDAVEGMQEALNEIYGYAREYAN